MKSERTYKLGRQAELIELQKGYRIEIDVVVSAVRDLFEPRDPDLAYTEKIDLARLRIFTKEIERKSLQLSKIARELAMLNAELDGKNE
jgi:hypothetical protein